MSRYSELLRVMTDNGLADKQLAAQEAQGARDAANTQAWSSSLQGLAHLVPDVAFKAGDVMQKSAQDEANVAAQQAIAQNTGTLGPHDIAEGPATESGEKPVGPYSQTPGAFADAAASGLGPQAKSGSAIDDFMADPFGYKAKAAAAARATATKGIADEVTANRDQEEKTTRQGNLDAATLARDSAATDAAKAQTADVAAQAKQRDTAAAKASKDEAVRAAVAKGLAQDNGSGRIRGLALISVQNPDLDEGDLAAEYVRQVGAGKDSDAKRSLEQANAAEAWARANQANATAKIAGGGKPIEEGARKDIAGMQSQLQQIANLQAQKKDVDTGKLSALQNSIAQFMGIDDPTKTVFRAQSAQLRDQIMHALSGAAVSPPEMARLLEGIPSFTDNDSAYSAKLKATQDALSIALGNRVGMEKAGGANVSGITFPADRSGSPPPINFGSP